MPFHRRTIRNLTIAALLSLAACAGGRDAGTAGGGVLVIATPGDADALFPPVSTSQLGRNVVDRVFLRLAELTLSLNTVDDSGFVPALATRWEHRDSTTLVFHLDPRARWHDGTRVTAGDVAFTHAIYTHADVGSPFRSNLEAIRAVTAADSATVVVTFTHAYPEQLYDATYHMRILPRHLLDTIAPARLASSAFASAPVGAGAWRFVRWAAGTEIVLAADTAFFLGRPHLDRLMWRVLPDVSAAVSAVIAGEADALETVPLRDEIERAARAPGIRLVPYPSPFLAGVAFNVRRPLFAGAAVRRALAMATDRATIVRSVFGDYADVPVGATSRMQWISQLPIRQLAYDTAAAAVLLDSLGWRRGADGLRARAGRPLRFTLLVPSTSRARQQAATLLQAQLRAAGADMVIQVVDFSVLTQKSERGDFDAVFFSRTLEASPTVLVADWSRRAIGGGNIGAWDSPAFDSVLALAVRAMTRDAAAPLYQAALERLNDEAPAIFVFAPRNNALLHDRYQNVTIRPDNWLATVSQWSIPPDRRLPRDAAGTAGATAR